MSIPGPDQRPAVEQRPVLQEEDARRFELPMRLESGMRGFVVVRQRHDGEWTAAISGQAVRVTNRIRGRTET